MRVGAVDLATRIDGEAGRPWIILSHSLATTYDMWDAQMALLTRTHRVLRYDTRGHGRSSTPPGPYGFQDLTGDIVGLMDHFAIERADLLGLSMGGMTMLGMAIDHPARVARLICGAARADSVPPVVAAWDTRIAAIRAAGGMGGVLELTLERWFTRAFREARPETIRAVGIMIRATDPEGYIACAAALKQLDYKRSLDKIAAPTLFVCGAHDQAAPSAVMREMADLTPGASYAEIDPGAHICNIENPERFNAVVGAWLARPLVR